MWASTTVISEGTANNGNIGETWAQFVTAQGSTTIKYVFLDLDGGWLSTQQLLVNNFTVNDQTFTVSAVPEASIWAMMLIGFAGVGFIAYRRSPKALAAA
jgi:PEP-CTERM motif-containing protein